MEKIKRKLVQLMFMPLKIVLVAIPFLARSLPLTNTFLQGIFTESILFWIIIIPIISLVTGLILYFRVHKETEFKRNTELVVNIFLYSQIIITICLIIFSIFKEIVLSRLSVLHASIWALGVYTSIKFITDGITIIDNRNPMKNISKKYGYISILSGVALLAIIFFTGKQLYSILTICININIFHFMYRKNKSRKKKTN